MSDIAKHEEHDQSSHGVWARSRAKVKRRRNENREQRKKRQAIVSDARAKKRKRYRRKIEDSLKRKRHTTGQLGTVILAKHTPGGQEHDQTRHGAWSSGPTQQTDTGTSSSGGGATFDTSSGGQRSSSPSPEAPDERRSSGRVSRPKLLSDLSGQGRVRERLEIMVDAARNRGTRLDHVMLSGPPGLGKTTIAKALANEMDSNIQVVTGPALKDRESLIDTLVKMEDGDILFIDEIHALPRKVEETMLPLLEDGEIDIQLEDGKVVRAKAPDVTVIGATTNPEGVVGPLRQRFGATERLDYYKPDELASLVQRTASKTGFELADDAARAIAMRSRGTPRVANRMVRRISDYLSARGGTPDVPTVDKILNLWDIDSRGLTSQDRRVMQSLRDLGGAGINTLSASTGLDESTLSGVVEPYLLRLGFITRSSKGRSLTPAGELHLEEYGGNELVSKRLDGPVFDAPVEIAKADDRQNLVFGWANVTMNDDGTQMFDHQGHAIDVEDLEQAAYNFSVKYRKTGDMHKGEGYGDLVESMVVTQDKIEKGGFPEDMLGKWWVGFRVPDEDWDRVASGERSMFSIQGRAQLEPA